MRKASIVASPTVLVMVAASLRVAIGNAGADQRNHDTYGYGWMDSDAPSPTVAFSWVEINASGTDTGLAGTFYEAGPLPMCLSFNFYVDSNRFISFNSGNIYEWFNNGISYQPSPDDFMALCWDNGESSDGTIYYEARGASPASG